jgi:hypothetical protein
VDKAGREACSGRILLTPSNLLPLTYTPEKRTALQCAGNDKYLETLNNNVVLPMRYQLLLLFHSGHE